MEGIVAASKMDGTVTTSKGECQSSLQGLRATTSRGEEAVIAIAKSERAVTISTSERAVATSRFKE